MHLIHEYNLPREVISTEKLNDLRVWSSLLDKMPLTATIRNLGKMTSIGLLVPLSAAAKTVCDRLGDKEYLQKSRIHPMNVLIAQRTYASGHGLKGSLSWTPVATIVDALEGAFYSAFGFIEAANKRTFIGVDVSGSMTSPISGFPISSCEAAACMAMVMARTEPQYHVMGFASDFRDLGITAKDTLAAAARKAQLSNFGSTNIPLAIQWPMGQGIEVDTFIIFTDNEVNSGSSHVCQALQAYRNKTGINSRLIVQAFTSTGFSVADPRDPLMLDLVGLDSASPALTTDFSAGRI